VTQLIARRVREEGVYSEIVPFQSAEKAYHDMKPKAVILSVGPASVTENQSPRAPQAVFNSGVPVLGIIAGFGVGGLAVALAAKPTLENLLAGVILFLDGSIKVGDTIDSGPLSGTIEDIGMRSTRIRSTDGGLISVTNSELADKVIKNTSRRVQPETAA
jgi:hypothetical protein